MKTRIYTILIAFAISLQFMAQPNAVGSNYYYDMSDNLSLEAVATVFAQAKNMKDFEYKLNDYRYQVSNLDLNNDGYVDYLRVVKLYETNQNVILIQAVLNNNYFQDVATIIVGRDLFNREYIQIIGDPDLFGANYVLEPTYVSRPRVVSWLWSYPTTIYVSQYYWGYYPRVYRMRTIIPAYSYYTYLGGFVTIQYRYVSNIRYPRYTTIIGAYARNDYWRNNPNMHFNNRNYGYNNKGYLQNNRPTTQPSNNTNPTHNEQDRRNPNVGTTVTRPEPRVTNTPTTTRTPSTTTRTAPVDVTTARPATQTDARVQTESKPQPRQTPAIAPKTATTPRTTTVPKTTTPSTRTLTPRTTAPKTTTKQSKATNNTQVNTAPRSTTTQSRPSGNRR